MKRFFNVLVGLSVVFISLSCTKDNGNVLKGTLWSFDDEVTVFEKHEFTRYIEFINETEVKVWDTNHNVTYSGTYETNGNKVTFYNLHDTYWGWHYINGIFSSNSLTISFSYDTVGPYNETYIKEK